MAEDGVIPEIYPVQELPGGGYWQRTQRNVIDSDGTVIIYFGFPNGGTEETLAFCIRVKKPYLLIDAEEIPPERAAKRVNEFIGRHHIAVLNIAGPRGSKEPRAYAYARRVMLQVLQSDARE